MGREYVPIFFEWLDTTQDLTQEEKGNLIDAVVSYASGNEYEHLLSGGCKIAFRFLKGQIDRNAAISDARSKAGSAKKEQSESNCNKAEQSETKQNKTEHSGTNSPKEKEKEKEKEKDKEINRRFAPPTTEEVSSYCRERGNQVDAQRFVDFYASKGWKVGNQPMKDWKAAVRTWESKDRTPIKAVPKVTAQNYEQRDYSDLEEEAMKQWTGAI